ncbi:hypothetical protein [Winogradskyella sp. SM1960]|uniref:hypothetical protein n=1 Tax=Winogradskyella sp. SM1960 TaxID=2865955 RepID=UPI001CD33159|nr:hypothetical protein [Winogradskyella sp. SM1960]
MYKAERILSGYFILFIIILMSCDSDEQTITDLNKVEIQYEENYLDDRIFFNSKDKMIYFITFYSRNSETTACKINAFNYELKKITSQKMMEYSYNPAISTNSIGIYNNQVEIYILSGDKLTILDGVDLNEIASLTIPNSLISNVKTKDGLLFISHKENTQDFVSVHNRHDLTLNPEAGNIESNSNYGYLMVFKDNLNQIRCLSFPRLSNDRYFRDFTFDNQGTYLNFGLGRDGNVVFRENILAKTNDNVDFILTGPSGTIHNKDELLLTESEKLKLYTGQFEDYFISDDGAYIYSIQNNLSIDRYNASTFILEESISINENGKDLFVTEDQFIVFDYINKKVSFSFYQK